MSVPHGYEAGSVGSREFVANRCVAASLAEVLRAHESVYEWAAGLPQPRAMRGRAPVYVAALPSTGIDVVVRHSWHGGLLAPVTGDRFRVPTRAPRELAMSNRLAVAGIGTPELLAYVLYPAGPGLRRVDVVTRYVRDAFDLGAVVADLAPGFDVNDTLPVVQSLLVQLADAHAVHPDLNVKNVLLSRSGRGETLPWVVDVDVVRIEPSWPPERVMRANSARLQRSLHKWRTRFGARIDDATIDAFVAGCNTAVHASHRERSA